MEQQNESLPLSELVDQFLAQGGAVKHIPTVLAETPPPRPRAPAKPAGVAVTPYIGPNDAADVAVIKRLLAKGAKTSEMEAALGCAYTKVQRLLTVHFADDPRVTLRRRVTYAERAVLREAATEARLLPLIREALAQGMIGQYPIARHLGCTNRTVLRIAAKHGLVIPSAKGKPRHLTCEPRRVDDVRHPERP